MNLEKGSSPLARGTPTTSDDERYRYGLIPARAGNTVFSHGFAPRLRAHPRSRGEHVYDVGTGIMREGSSPLARGTLQPVGWASLNRGLIPARAGNTKYELHPRRTGWAHPRSRGEHGSFLSIYGSFRGSSPLARGTLCVVFSFGVGYGLIPARAGNTLITAEIRSSLWAHPRSRGEHVVAMSTAWAVRGSSPLARGTR